MSETFNAAVPHITVISSFKSRDQIRIVEEFEAACKNGDKDLHITLKSPGTFPENNVVFIDTKPSQGIFRLQADLYARLHSFVRLSQYDTPNNYHPHLTVWYKMTAKQYSRMKNYIFSRQNLPKYSGNNIRITLLRGSKILREYDVQTRRMMNRTQALKKE